MAAAITAGQFLVTELLTVEMDAKNAVTNATNAVPNAVEYVTMVAVGLTFVAVVLMDAVIVKYSLDTCLICYPR